MTTPISSSYALLTATVTEKAVKKHSDITLLLSNLSSKLFETIRLRTVRKLIYYFYTLELISPG